MSNYLKYYRVIKKYMKVKYKLKEDQLDILFFLYDEPLFAKSRVNEFEAILWWDKKRWAGLLRDGYIKSHRISKRNNSRLYSLSPMGKKIVENFYNLLEGGEIPVEPTVNPMFKRKVGYSDKVYRRMIVKINAAIYANERQKAGEPSYIDPLIFESY